MERNIIELSIFSVTTHCVFSRLHQYEPQVRVGPSLTCGAISIRVLVCYLSGIEPVVGVVVARRAFEGADNSLGDSFANSHRVVHFLSGTDSCQDNYTGCLGRSGGMLQTCYSLDDLGGKGGGGTYPLNEH